MYDYVSVGLPVMLTGLSCTACEHEIPASEAVVVEAVDYVVHFCGLDCYQRWRSRQPGLGPIDGPEPERVRS
jgi:hypothetical protein